MQAINYDESNGDIFFKIYRSTAIIPFKLLNGKTSNASFLIIFTNIGFMALLFAQGLTFFSVITQQSKEIIHSLF